jgi:hypothetical protein
MEISLISAQRAEFGFPKRGQDHRAAALTITIALPWRGDEAIDLLRR